MAAGVGGGSWVYSVLFVVSQGWLPPSSQNDNTYICAHGAHTLIITHLAMAFGPWTAPAHLPGDHWSVTSLGSSNTTVSCSSCSKGVTSDESRVRGGKYS